eukprot:9480407-Pyramimonas_sp.AAC.1
MTTRLLQKAAALREWAWRVSLRAVQSSLKDDANMHYARIAADIGDAWSNRQSKRAYARLRGMGIGSEKKRM